MGFFDFLKRFNSEKEEIKEIKIEKLEEWLDSYFSEIFEKINLELINIKKEIYEEKNNIQGNIKKLIEAKLKNANITERFKQIMEGNVKTYITKVNMLLKKIDLPKEFDEISKFCDIFDKDLNHFSKSTIRNYYVLQEFFYHEISAVSMDIRRLSILIKKIKNIVKNSKIEQIKELKDKLKELQQKLKRKVKLIEEIELIKEELQKEKKKINEKEKKIKEFKEGSDHKKLIKLINDVKVLKLEKKELEKTQSDYFSVIKTALKKYEKINLDDKLIRKYLDDSLKALLEDKKLKIVNIIHKMKESITKGELKLKEKKEKRILLELNKPSINYFKSFLNKHNELSKKLDDLNLEIEKIDIIERIEKMKDELNWNKTKLEDYNNKVKEMVKELEKIDIKDLEKNLEENIKKNINKEIKIIS